MPHICDILPLALRSAFLALTKHLKCDFSDDKPKKMTKKVNGFSLMKVQIWWVAETFLLLENTLMWV